MAEIPFEYLLVALEAARGTAINPPTHYLNMAGTITPKQDVFEPDESSGTLDQTLRSKVVRRWGEWEASGGLDVYTLCVLAEMGVKGGGTITTPGGTSPRLHTYTPTTTADNLKSGTMYWGDPNVQAFQATWAMCDEITIGLDASGTDGATMGSKGRTLFPSKTAPSSLPTQTLSPLITPAMTQIWLDTGASAIGTTELATRLVKADITIPTGVTYKRVAGGPTAGPVGYNRCGRTKSRPQLTIELELLDMAQWDIFAGNDGDTICKVRVRANGPVIETTYRHYVEFDIYGPLREPSWGALAESNRTISFTIPGHRDATLGASYSLKIQNDRNTL